MLNLGSHVSTSRSERPIAALRSRRLFETDDVDFARDQISQVLQPHRLDPCGKWHGTRCSAEHLSVGEIGIGTLRFGNMRVQVPEVGDHYIILMCLEGGALVHIDDRAHAMGRHAGLILSPGMAMDATFSADCEQMFVRIPRSQLIGHTTYRHLEFAQPFDLSRPALRPLMAQLAVLAGDNHTADLLQSHAVARGDYQRLLVGLLVAGQPHAARAFGGKGVAATSVRRAEAYIHAHAAEPVTLGQIAKAANISTRALSNGFRRFRGTSPIRFLLDVRLDLAREMFRSSEYETVTDVALGAGFAHLGRFSAQYFERFGELPSDTIRAGKRR
jgi:AraC-like DNA-binding protein